MKKIFYLGLLFIFSFSTSFSQSTPIFVSESLDTYVQLGLEQWKIPGAAVLIVKDGKVVFKKGFGVKELGKSDKVDENTLFLIGSNTKAFTGTLLALLENEGKCKLDDKVIDYIPDFRMKDPWVTRHINLTDIVSHRIGMETFQGDFMYWTSDLTSDECIEKFGKLTPLYDFRSKYGYTNLGFAIAGKVIEKITGLTLAENLQNRIFTPLKMNHTIALSEDYINAENTAKPHTFVDGKMSEIPVPIIDNLSPAGSIASSINDLSHWVIAQLDSGNFDGVNVIPNKAIEKTKQPNSIVRRINHPLNRSHFSLYGMGWEMRDYFGKEIVSHTGGVNGFVTSLTLMPEENLGIVVLTNNDQNAFYVSLKWEIIDAYLGLPFSNYDSSYYAASKIGKNENHNWIKQMKDSVAMKLNPTLNLEDYAGRYENEAYGYLNIIQKENYLEMSFEHHSHLRGKLESLSENKFLCTYSDPTYGIKVIPFEIRDGGVKSMTLFVDNFIEYTPYEFVKK